MKRAVRRLLRRTDPAPSVPSIYVWSIGIYGGRSPWELSPASAVANPVLTRHDVSDVRAVFVADPFMLRAAGSWYMFFEVMNAQTARGEIGLATSADGVRWKYNSIVLREPFHISYPYVFESGGEYFMVPETHQAGAVRLYRAERFPWDWKLVNPLVHGPCLSDASLFEAQGKWWMFVETNAGKFDTLCLYTAKALDGGWSEHPASPIVTADPHTARPGGRVVVHDGRIIRFAQDCQPRYGLSVSALEVLELGPHAYRERILSPAPMLSGTGSGWNRDGMHHVDAHLIGDDRWTACVDGWAEAVTRSSS